MEGIDTKLSKFINIGFIVTLVASPILTTSTTVSAAQNNLESVANTFEETNESITNFEFVRQSTTEIVYNSTFSTAKVELLI
jgi:hypothetical protein